MAKRKAWWKVGTTLSILLLLAFFSLHERRPAVTIAVGDWPRENTARRRVYEDYAAQIRKKQNIIIEPDEWAYSINSFLPKAAVGKLPTIYNTWFTEVQKIINAGYAVDITTALQERGWDRALNPMVAKIIMRDGKFYGFPRDAYLMGLMCNLKLFRAAGLVDANGRPLLPQTYEELIRTAQIIKEKTGAAGFLIETNGNGGGWHFMNIAWSYGAEFEREVDGRWRAVFNSPEAVAALQLIKDLRWKYDVLPGHTLIDWAKAQELIATDQCAMKFEAGFDHNGFDYVIDHYHMAKEDIAMTSVPAGPKGRVALMGGNIYMFAPNSTADQLEAALEWLRLLGMSPDVSAEGLRYIEDSYRNDFNNGYVVGNVGVPVWTDPAFLAANEAIRTKYVNVNPEYFAGYINRPTVTIRLEEPFYCQELYAILDGVIQTVITDPQADPQLLLDQAVDQFQREYLDKLGR